MSYTVKLNFRYRTDNWGHGRKEGGKDIPTSSSAYEWVSSSPDSNFLMFTTDEAMGMGFSIMDLTKQE